VAQLDTLHNDLSKTKEEKDILGNLIQDLQNEIETITNKSKEHETLSSELEEKSKQIEKLTIKLAACENKNEE